jgi:hypothetical protein
MLSTNDCSSNVYSSLTNRERVRYFPRQLLTAEDMRAEQEYFREKQRRHNRLAHGWGVICGMEIKPPEQGDPDTQVTVCPGAILTPCGDEIYVADNVKVDVKTGLQSPEPCAPRWPCPPETGTATSELTIVHLAIRFSECNSRPVRLSPNGCGCEESACEYSRVRDSFELRCLAKVPDSHLKMKDFYEQLCVIWTDWATQSATRGNLFPLPVPTCPPCDDDPWIVLATITLPTTEHPRILSNMIKYDERISLFSTNVLQILATCK